MPGQFTGIYPGRTFSGSQNPHQWFGNVTPAEGKWKPRGAAEGGGMPREGYIPDDMWQAVLAQAPGDLSQVEPNVSPRQSIRALLSAVQGGRF